VPGKTRVSEYIQFFLRGLLFKYKNNSLKTIYMNVFFYQPVNIIDFHCRCLHYRITYRTSWCLGEHCCFIMYCFVH